MASRWSRWGRAITNVSLFAGSVCWSGLKSIPIGGVGHHRRYRQRVRHDGGCRLSGSSASTVPPTASPRDNHEMVDDPRTDSEDDDGQRGVAASRSAAADRGHPPAAGTIGQTEISKAALKDLEALTGPVGAAGRPDRRRCGTEGHRRLRAAMRWGASVRIGRPRGLTGLPEAHSGTGLLQRWRASPSIAASRSRSTCARSRREQQETVTRS